jgi:hypothetical protein
MTNKYLEKISSTALLRALAKKGVSTNTVGSHGWTAYSKATQAATAKGLPGKAAKSLGAKAMEKAESQPAAAELNHSLGLRSNVEEVHKALKTKSPLDLHQEYHPGQSFPDGKTFIRAKVRE